ncbi:hypothetical protein BU17DRAFT_65010 [Hysterangium stoloniferum]|nr:hypothetical protein BU17DRAFT_65010 [Hysterangium stoloniferum]
MNVNFVPNMKGNESIRKGQVASCTSSETGFNARELPAPRLSDPGRHLLRCKSSDITSAVGLTSSFPKLNPPFAGGDREIIHLLIVRKKASSFNAKVRALQAVQASKPVVVLAMARLEGPDAHASQGPRALGESGDMPENKGRKNLYVSGSLIEGKAEDAPVREEGTRGKWRVEYIVFVRGQRGWWACHRPKAYQVGRDMGFMLAFLATEGQRNRSGNAGTGSRTHEIQNRECV